MCLLQKPKARGESIADQHLQGSDAESVCVRRFGVVQRAAHPAGGRPQGWCCYDLCGTAEDPRRPCKLVDQAEKNHAGTVLSYLPLKTGHSQSRLVKDELQLTAASATLSKFCSDEKIRMPEIPLRHLLRPASPKRRGFSMPRRRRETRSLALSAISASTLDTTDAKASTTPGGPEAPEHPGIPG